MKDIIIKQWNYLYDADMSLKIQIMATLVVVYVVTMVLLVQLRRYRTGLPVVKGTQSHNNRDFICSKYLN